MAQPKITGPRPAPQSLAGSSTAVNRGAATGRSERQGIASCQCSRDFNARRGLVAIKRWESANTVVQVAAAGGYNLLNLAL